MSARTCQLCGKPLSRIWVGAGGDFCSREHRNQYRLRLGMDRLQEANKVATLMRRRENPKPVQSRLMESAHSLMRQDFPDNAKWPHPRVFEHILPPLQPHGAAHLPAERRAYIAPRPREAVLPADTQRNDYLPIRQDSALQPFLAALRASMPPLHIPAADAARTRRRWTQAPDSRRGFGSPRKPARHAHLGDRNSRRPAGTASYSSCHMLPRKVAMMPQPGTPLRVSTGNGFRLAQTRLRPVAIGRPPAPQMIWPSWRMVRPSAGEGPAAVASLAAVSLPHPGLRLPVGPPAAREHAINPGRPRPIRGAAQIRRAEQRASALPWPHFEESYSVLPPPVEMAARIDCCAWQGRAPRRSARIGLAGSPAPRLAIVPFEPQELPFGYSAFEIHTGMSSVPAGEQPRAAAPAPGLIEDHFDNGWANWIGGIADWKIDAAGVRTGSFALFAPSLDLADYDLEFLARIDQRSITWVFRATDESEYHLATLAHAPGGRSFTRSTVIDGNPGLSVTKALRSAANPKAAITVQTRIRGNEFAVLVDGEMIDRWTDNRLPIGGAGFVSAPDDRARLYWVRVSPAGGIAKENIR